ncbi:MAG: hypothetical protein JRC86_07945 [Deltaproteobacteria bacterium]|nr:hypothetical protein [Deltaproteobacteria bacterium]
MSEHDLQTGLITAINFVGGHASNVESGLTSAGIPDVDYCVEGIVGHVEVKHYRKTKPLHLNAPDMKPSQVKWFRDRIKAGEMPMILSALKVDLGGRPTECFVLHEGKYFEDLAKLKSTGEWLEFPNVSWWGEQPDWGMIIRLLTRKELILP